ncbi:NACHT-ANK domain protein transcript variant 3 [Tuber magnatum]|uniref:NACHT-ANK domain protein transcript variant 3 n=1 Tax=Tuber magnatum TaxID=42249 RepID=A0A317SK42_9PEZI|nr:NACHT-ANK domain protein transcript variant 3 [Tuber magnatum]
MASSEIHGDGSGNSGSNNNINSGNTTITVNCDSGDTDSSKNHAKILQSLYTSRYEERRDRVREPADGTCAWVTEHPNHLESRTDAIVCYFFFKDDSDEQRSATFALCAILHQLFTRRTSLCRFAWEAFHAKRKGFTEEVNTLWNILVRAVAEGGSGYVVCVVDALDECKEGTLFHLIRHLTRLPASQTFDVPLKFLRELGSPAATIRLKGEKEVNAITADVARLIDKGVRDLESYWEQPGGLGYRRRLLGSSADRTFLWVSLVLEILRNSEDGSPEEFTRIVSTAPPDIAELYTKILDKSASPDKARRILNIVVAAARPLTLREMNTAFRIRREHKTSKDVGDLPRGFEKTVKNLCGLFVRVIGSKIYLIHQTAREFLIRGSSPGAGSWQYTLNPQDSNFVLADICISYLSLEDFKNDPLSHACKEGYHFRDSQDRQMELFEFTRPICGAESESFLTWFRVYWHRDERQGVCPKDFTHLMIASWLGQGAVVSRLLEEGGDINARCKRYGTALNIAALQRNEDITKMLLGNNVNACKGVKEYKILHVKIPLGWE